MSQESYSSSPRVGDSDWDSITKSIEKFEDAWTALPRPEIADFVPHESTPTISDETRIGTILELIRIDQERRWQRGEKKWLEAYLDEWPELRTHRGIVKELLASECLTRFFEGDPPPISEVRRRFPDLWDSIDLCALAAAAQREGARLTESVVMARDSTVTQGGHQISLERRSFGRYVIVEFLGAGSMGTVFRASDPNLERDVALKIPQWGEPRQLERFMREAKLAAKIRHPNICPIYDADEVGGVHFITMALIKGPTLAEYAKTHCLTPSEAADIVRKIAAALEHVHNAGTIHRDIKPSNIMLDATGQPLLMDFGLARGAGLESSFSSTEDLPAGQSPAVQTPADLSATGAMIGTPAFMSPEQVTHGPIDARSDIYNLGVVLYQLLTGKLPFVGPVDRVMRDIVDRPPTPPRQLRPDISEHLQAVCLKAMAKDPGDRFQTAGEFAAALDHTDRSARRVFTKKRIAIVACLFLLCFGVWMVARPSRRIEEGWWRKGYDLGNTRYYPLATRRPTTHRLEKLDWEPQTDYGPAQFIRTGDIDKDGTLDLVTCSAERVAVYNHTGAELWSASPIDDAALKIPVGFHKSAAPIELVDLDNDDRLEIVTFATVIPEKGFIPSFPVKAIVYEPQTKEADTSCTTIFDDVIPAHGKPINCFDYNEDGYNDLVLAVAAFEHPHAVCVYDLMTHETLFVEKFADYCSVSGVGDVTGDGRPELLLLQEWDSHVDSPIDDYDADHCYATLFDLKGNRLWCQTYRNALSGCLADLDGDGVLDIVLIHRSETRGAIHILDPQDGTPRFSYTDMKDDVFRCWSVADLTGNGHQEIICGDGERVLAIDDHCRLVAEQASPVTRVAATNDLDGDGDVEVVAFQRSDLLVLGQDLSEIARMPLSGAVRTVIVSDMQADGINDMIALVEPTEQASFNVEIVQFVAQDRKPLPKDVAVSFLRHLQKNNIDAALTLVRDQWKSTVQAKLKGESLSSIPQDLPLVIIQHGDATASAHIKGNSTLRLQMEYDQQQWWVNDITW